MNKWMIAVCTCLVLTGCVKKNTFIVEGNITGAKNSMLYLDHVGVSQVDKLDSIKLTESGTFKWEKPRPEYPGFYRLRLKNQLINIAIDSLETITVEADSAHFATNYTIEGSDHCKEIQRLTLLQIRCNQSYKALKKEFDLKKITDDTFISSVNQIIKEYKDSASVVIMRDPQSTAAYFALFQQIDGLLIFDPYLKEDNMYFGAVATSWDVHYPDAPRTRQLRNLTLSARKTIRSSSQPIQYKEASMMDVFDIKLPDIYNDSIRLSEVAKGKIVILDFTAYQMQGSAGHNMRLNELYEKYNSRGLIIYQVSLDADEHLWKNAAYNLPWICVRDDQGVYSSLATNYNVQSLPTTFIVNRAGELMERVGSYEQMSKDIAKLF